MHYDFFINFIILKNAKDLDKNSIIEKMSCAKIKWI